MWTSKNRGRYDRSRLRYPSDLTNEEWAQVGPLIPPAKGGGNKRTVNLRERSSDGPLKLRSAISAVGKQPGQKRKRAEQSRHQRRAAVTVLDVGGVDDRLHQQALRIDEDVALFAHDLLAGVVTRRVDREPPFSALFTLWLSMIAAVGLTSRATASRHFT